MQGFDPKVITYSGLHCEDCGDTFSVDSSTGPVNICDPCTQARVTAIFSDDIPPEHLLPVPGDRISCGMRKHLPKSERGHDWVSLGIDVRHFDDGYLMEAEVFACTECGRDKMKRPYVPRVIVDETALDALIVLAGEAGRDAVKALNPKKIKR